MYTVLACILTEHDLRLVGLAAVICALASFAAISLLHHVRRSKTAMRRVWLVVAATATGFGIWATHFIAMLAFSPGLPTAYNIALTTLSLVAAIFLTWAGLAVAILALSTVGAALGGAMVGGGIAAMHYTGMAAFEITGRIVWDPVLVTASIALGALIGAAALPIGLRADQVKWKVLGAVLLTLAICSHHFTAMGAAAIVPDPTVVLSETSLPAGLLAVATAFASFVIIVLALGGVALDMRDRRRSEETEKHISFLAHHDALTGLANRSSFNHKLDHEIEAAMTGGRRLAVLCMDLDRFKDVNDLFGHTAGDQVLQAFARRVAALLAENQMMARLSGDEFAIIMPDLAHPSTAGRLAETIMEALQTVGEESKTGAPIAASFGIAICPDDATDREALLSHANAALSRAKNEGRGIYRYFEASMGAAVRERRVLEHDLRNAIARGELRLVYQPQNDIRTGAVVGFEALLRWRHATRGDVSPAEFIPIAEDTGIILQMGEWVLRTACREAATWSQPVTMAVNVSAVQIHNANFAHVVHEVLFETGLAPGRLELEITETALVRDLNRALATLRRIKMLGVRIAMDDFGTGYSSLSNLRAFPFDKIKIDRSFIKSVNANEQAAAIVRSVLGLGRALKLPVLAEGVETPAEFDFLKSELCDEAQGYLLGKPAAIESFRRITHGGEQPEPVAVPVAKVAATA